jgi:hypothetical protein
VEEEREGMDEEEAMLPVGKTEETAGIREQRRRGKEISPRTYA